MSDSLKLDLQWLDKAMGDFRSSTSTILSVQTADPMRVKQLYAYLLADFRGKVYQFHPWSGLRTLGAADGGYHLI
jgi:hypothetical protein